MKKVIVIASLFVAAFSTHANAQARVKVFDGATGAEIRTGADRPSESLSLNFTKVEGRNTVKLGNGKGTVRFDARGDKFTNVEFIDASGKTTRLIPNAGGTAGAPKQDCKYPIPDACFGTADKSIGLCMCRPTNLSAGGGGNDPNAILIGLLLPAVQKVRDAAH